MDNLEQRALEYATVVHSGVYRKGKVKEEYINHPIRVAGLVREYKKHSKAIEYLVAAAYLHDTIEDTKGDKNAMFNDIVEKFGIQVASLVRELTSVDELKKEIGKTKYLAFELVHMSNWALDIKLCDRLDNISYLNNVDEIFKCKYIKETYYIINYLLENRKLSKTHLRIIKDITCTLQQYKINVETNNKLLTV